jgi:hypothetical protein
MWSLPDPDETVLPIEPQVPFHLVVRVKPNLMQPKRDGSFIDEIEQSSSISFPLCLRAHSDAVNQEVLGIFLQDGYSSRLAFNL